MTTFLKIILIIFALAYLISPFDILPDLLVPYFGYLDDIGLIGIIFYILRYSRLPGFLSKFNSKYFQHFQTLFENNTQKPDENHFKQDNKRKNKTSNFTKQKTKKPAHEILGVKANASKEEIQAAYKEAVKKYHPDKVSHLGDEFQKLANEKFVEIQQAFNTLIKNK